MKSRRTKNGLGFAAARGLGATASRRGEKRQQAARTPDRSLPSFVGGCIEVHTSQAENEGDMRDITFLAYTRPH